eukprot:PITA_25919
MQQPIWVDAMVEEYDSIVRNSVWDVVLRPDNKSVVSSHWLYKVKQAVDGSVEKHKAIFIARGFSEVEGIDYDDNFASVIGYSSIRSMLALSSQMDWKIHQMDVKTEFLKGQIEEEVYIEHPKVLRPSIVSRMCADSRERFDRVLQGGPCKRIRDEIHGSHALLLWHGSVAEGWGVVCVSGQVCQQDTQEIPHGEVQAHVDSSVDLCYAVKNVLRYLRGTSQYGLWYRQTEGVKLQSFTDADWAWSPSDRKSTSGGIFNLGSAAVSSYIRKRRSVALSSAEAEYMATSRAACEATWMRKILVGLFDQRMDLAVIYCDNQSCIKLSEKPVFHDRSKHIDIWEIIHKEQCKEIGAWRAERKAGEKPRLPVSICEDCTES